MTGAQIISKERQNQIDERNFTPAYDSKVNLLGQLVFASAYITVEPMTDSVIADFCPSGWGKDYWAAICQKSYKDRLKLAGSFLAAELDRLRFDEFQKSKIINPELGAEFLPGHKSSNNE